MRIEHKSFHAESTKQAGALAHQWLTDNADIWPVRIATEPDRVTVSYYRRSPSDDT